MMFPESVQILNRYDFFFLPIQETPKLIDVPLASFTHAKDIYGSDE